MTHINQSPYGPLKNNGSAVHWLVGKRNIIGILLQQILQQSVWSFLFLSFKYKMQIVIFFLFNGAEAKQALPYFSQLYLLMLGWCECHNRDHIFLIKVHQTWYKGKQLKGTLMISYNPFCLFLFKITFKEVL